MRKCFVCLGHLVDFVPFTDGITLALVSFKYLSRKGFLHRHAFAAVGKIHQPAQGQRELAIGGNFEGDLVGCAADATGFYLQARLGIIYRSLQDIERTGRGILFGNLVESAINDALSDTLFATFHNSVDEARNQRAVEFRILQNGTLDGLTATGHFCSFKKVKSLKR
jgi:hypothetical protein